MGLLTAYNLVVYDSADLRTRDWPFLGDFMPILCIVVAYLYIIKVAGPQFMKNRPPYNLKRIIQIYNITQVVFCVLVMRAIHNNIPFSILIGHHLPDRSNNYHAIQQTNICWWILCLKIFDMIETVFFVLRKKYNQASFLHLHHHVITLIMSWMLANYYPGGSALFPVQLNTFIHFVMYTYYFLSTLGPKWQNVLGKWKNKLTILQMIQFTIMLIHAIQLLVKWPLREIPMTLYLICVPNLILIYKNFYDFYKKTYTNKTA